MTVNVVKQFDLNYADENEQEMMAKLFHTRLNLINPLHCDLDFEIDISKCPKVHFSYHLLRIQIHPSILATFEIANQLPVKLKLQTTMGRLRDSFQVISQNSTTNQILEKCCWIGRTYLNFNR